MAIDFSDERMEQALENHMRWWNGTLDKPLMAITLRNARRSGTGARAPLLSQANCTDFSWTPEEVIEAIDEELSKNEYLGDAYPYVNFDAFGPGVLAAFCGANLDNSSGRVWFFPRREEEIADIRVKYDPANPWSSRIKAIYRAGIERWGRTVVMGMPDLGGVLDAAAVFRGSQNLAMDLYDDPEEVLRLCGEIEGAWRDAYLDMSTVLHPAEAGYTDWSGLLSREPSYIIQCDFSYMIGNEMFRQFVLPTLRRDVGWLENAIYHLDGVGELNHLDTILELEKLRAVQWVFGDGKPGPMHWLDVYRKIRSAGKRMMVLGRPGEVLETIRTLGGTGMYSKFTLDAGDKDLAEELLAAR